MQAHLNLEAQIANRIAALRKERRMTLRELAETIGLSEAYFSRLENHKAPISVDNLAKIAAALEVPLEQFFPVSTADAPLVINRAGNGKKARLRGKDGYLGLLLASGKRRKIMEPLLIDVHSTTSEIPLKQHAGQEFDYILEGSCQLIFGKDKYILSAGDSAYFEAGVPHAVRPITKKKCRLLAIVGSDEFPLHGDLLTLLNGR